MDWTLVLKHSDTLMVTDKSLVAIEQLARQKGYWGQLIYHEFDGLTTTIGFLPKRDDSLPHPKFVPWEALMEGIMRDNRATGSGVYLDPKNLTDNGFIICGEHMRHFEMFCPNEVLAKEIIFNYLRPDITYLIIPIGEAIAAYNPYQERMDVSA